VLVEYGKGSSPSETYQVILHTFWGGKVNRPLAIALGEAWERKHRSPLEAFATNDHIMLMMPEGVDVEELLALVPASALDELLRSGLEKTALFGARFRENASRALLLPRGDARKRTPLWLNRIRAKKLLGSVLRFEDFPLVLETWRELLEDEFDLTTLGTLLDDIADRRITLHVTRPAHLTPFSDGVVFRQTNYHMYLDDAAASGGQSNLADELFRDLFAGASDLPAVPHALVEAFTSKLLRTHPDYRPSSRLDVLLAVREMPLLPKAVLDTWLAATEKPDADDPLKSVVCYRLPGATDALVADAADLPRILDLRGVAPGDLPSLALAADGGPPPAIDHRARRNDESSPSLLLGELLRGRGPLTTSDMTAALGWNKVELSPLLDELLESGSIVTGMLVQGRPERTFCDAEHAERLLRLFRAARRGATQAGLAARPVTDLPHFLLEWQGLGRATGSLESLQIALDRLFGFPATADLWEGAILPSRLAPYFPSWMDTLFQSYGVRWFGCGKEKVSLVMMGEEDVLLEEKEDEESSTEQAGDDGATELVRRLRESGRGLGFAELATSTDESSATLAERLWALAWQGRATTDSFETIRRGVLSGYAAEPVQQKQTGGRAGFRRWQRSRPSSGHWQALDVERDTSPLARAERDKERARLVLDRYGVVFRELLEHELPTLRWSRLFRALRLLELSGEIVAGHFFAGIPGLQFASHEAVRRLGEALPQERLYFVNACDPASVCGLGIDGLSAALPRRLAGHWLVFHASQLLLALQKGGKELSVVGEPAPAVLESGLGIYRFLLGREAAPQSSVTVETINGQNASTSPYADMLRTVGFTSDYRGMSLWKR
jgi:ATP-dependent Lhr-like helicase